METEIIDQLRNSCSVNSFCKKINVTLKKNLKIKIELLKFLQIKEGKLIIAKLFKVLFIFMTIVLWMRI